MAEDDAKQYLYGWLGKQKQGQPEYNVRSTGPPHRQRFVCELRVAGINYTAFGNSANKKDAQTNAARDFIAYLVREGKLSQNELPPSISTPGSGTTSFGSGIDTQQRKSVFQSGYGPESLGDAYRRSHAEGASESSGGDFKQQFLDDLNRRKMEEAEDADVNASIHGNWTMENSKSMLHQWMQSSKIKAEYKYSTMGPDHNRSFMAEMSFFVKDLRRTIGAREAGSNKQSASKSCALSLVRQLFHLGVIGPFTGSLKKNRDIEELPPYRVVLAPNLQTRIEHCLQEFGLSVVTTDTAIQEGESLSLLTSNTLNEDSLFPDGNPSGRRGGVVSWCPPSQNWNPWMGCNIDEGPLAAANLDSISRDLHSEWSQRQKDDKPLQESNQSRSQLPIFHRRNDIMKSIYENQVVLIRGNTGCGKTTQVCQYILDDFVSAEQGALCNVIITQPRRISAISVAERVAGERCEDLGISIGYSVRFESVLPRPYGKFYIFFAIATISINCKLI